MFKFAIYGALTAAAIARVAAECPNACSMQGTCSAKDQCQCFKNRIGNDCAERICPFGPSFVDSPVGDLDMSGALGTSAVLTNSQMYPQGTYEQAPVLMNEEAHHYRECGMRGDCNRATGECSCYLGFEGSACQRTTCPDNCNGVGVCETIQEFATDRTGTLYGNKQKHTYTYDLWDANVIRGCKCDPRYYGVSCSKRRCKVGVDPMYECAGSEILETVLIAVGMDDNDANEVIQAATSYYRLRLYDYWGEMYETDRITVTGTSSTDAAAAQLAIRALPNSAFSGFTCGAAGSGSFAFVNSAPISFEGALIACEYTNNPGKHRTMELIESVVHGAANTDAESKTAFIAPTSKLGEDIDYFASASSSTGTATTGSATLTLNTADGTNCVDNKLLKVGSQIFMVASGGGSTSITMSGTFEDNTVTAGSVFYSGYTVSKYTATVASVAVGATAMVVSAHAEFAVGHVLFYANVRFTVMGVNTGTDTLTLDRPFPGAADGTGGGVTGATDAIWRITNTPTTGLYQYVDECSGRGDCDETTGLCTCYKGYTNDNCDTQNIMSL